MTAPSSTYPIIIDMESKSTDQVTPWNISVQDAKGVDYNKISIEFGCQTLTSQMLERFERLISKPLHPFLRRNLFFAHRDFDKILDCLENKTPFYIYTGRGPSSKCLHLGHLAPFLMVKWLQDALDCPLVIQMTDDEKFLFREELKIDDMEELMTENLKDILACGFNLEKTFIFSNMKYIGTLYKTALEIQKRVTFNQVKGIFGFNESSNIGIISFPSIQAAPSFPTAFPGLFGTNKNIKKMYCLIPCAIDQDPYFRMTRDVAPRMKMHKPCLLLGKFLPALQGAQTKMSASMAASSIYLNDPPNIVKNKINKYAFSGGKASIEEHRKYGADISVDVSYEYLRYFLDDDVELDRIRNEYASGKMLTSEVKSILVNVINSIFSEHQARRAALTKDQVEYAQNPDRPKIRASTEAALETMRKFAENKKH